MYVTFVKKIFFFICALCRSLTTNIVGKSFRFPEVLTKLHIDWKKNCGTILHLQTLFSISYPRKHLRFLLHQSLFPMTTIPFIIHRICLCHMIGGFKNIIGPPINDEAVHVLNFVNQSSCKLTKPSKRYANQSIASSLIGKSNVFKDFSFLLFSLQR